MKTNLRLPKFSLGLKLNAAFIFILLLIGIETSVAVLVADASGRYTVVIVGLSTIVGSSIAGWWISRDIAHSLQEALVIAKRISSGDLTVKISTDDVGQIRELMESLQEMNDQVFRIVSKVRNELTTVTTTSSQINRDNAALSERTDRQATSLRDTVSSMEQLTETVRQNAENAGKVSKHVISTSQHAARGGEVVRDVVVTMGSIRESSKKIVDIISVIDGIAFQTNILALNASVEAAMAGEHGRGFAVVASEVRILAQRSAAAAKEIKKLISDSVEKVESGSRLVDAAGSAMNEIVLSVNHAANLINEISAAGAEQSARIQLVNQAIGQIDAMTQQNAKLVQDATKTAVTLNEQAVGLLNSVSTFTLGDQEYGSEQEAKVMVKSGLSFLMLHGKNGLLDEINKLGKSCFIDRDLYLFAVDIDNSVFLAHGSNPRLVGAGPSSQDADGRFFVREMAAMAKRDGRGWIEYKWAHPVTNQIKRKATYVERVGDILIACGVYKP